MLRRSGRLPSVTARAVVEDGSLVGVLSLRGATSPGRTIPPPTPRFHHERGRPFRERLERLAEAVAELRRRRSSSSSLSVRGPSRATTSVTARAHRGGVCTARPPPARRRARRRSPVGDGCSGRRSCESARRPVEHVLGITRMDELSSPRGEDPASASEQVLRTPRPPAGPRRPRRRRRSGGISLRPFQISTSTPDSASSRSARRRAVFVRGVAEGAADREDAHRGYASCATSVRSAFRVTSLPSAGSPFGSGMFQFMSNAVRSMTVSSLRPIRVAPK